MQQRHARSAALLRLAFALLGGSFLSGCASLPDTTLAYYLPKTKLELHATRVVACDAGQNLVDALSVKADVLHRADTTKRHEIPLASLKGWLTDTDFKVDFFDDGRLSGINATSTGQGEATAKAVVSLAMTAATLAFDGVAPVAPTTDYAKLCALIAQSGGKTKTYTVAYEARFDFDGTSPAGAHLIATPRLHPVAVELERLGLGIDVSFAAPAAAGEPMNRIVKAEDGVVLRLRQPAVYEAIVSTPEGGAAREVWRGPVPIAQYGVEYDLPIPKGKPFGVEKFTLSLDESGGLKSVQFVKQSGTAAAAGGLESVLSALKKPTAEDKASALQAQADEIKQMQRLVKCRADPVNCS